MGLSKKNQARVGIGLLAVLLVAAAMYFAMKYTEGSPEQLLGKDPSWDGSRGYPYNSHPEGFGSHQALPANLLEHRDSRDPERKVDVDLECVRKCKQGGENWDWGYSGVKPGVNASVGQSCIDQCLFLYQNRRRSKFLDDVRDTHN
jgi:hypothetical protein